MDADKISEMSKASLLGTLSFPEIVKNLIEAGVEYYHVDYVSKRKHFYSGSGNVVVTSLTFEDLPQVAPELSIPSLKEAIIDSQQNRQTYREFSKRAMNAGVQGYTAFLRGQRVTYWGRTGDQHIEWFPGTRT